MACGWMWWGVWYRSVPSRWVVGAPALLCMHTCMSCWQVNSNSFCSLRAGSGLALPLLHTLHPNVQAEMKEPLRSLVQLPVDAEGLAQRLPKGLRPPGL